MTKSIPNAIYGFLVFFISISTVAMGKDTLCDFKKQSAKDNYDVIFYHIDLNISDSSTYIQGSTSILLKSVIPSLQQVVLDFSDKLVADSVLINGQKVNYAHAYNELAIDLTSRVASGDMVTPEIFYHGLGKYSGVSSGIFNNTNSTWHKTITWTLSEPFSAMIWFPCKQSLTDKADSVYVFLSTNNNLKAGSNGLLTAQVPLPGNRIRYEWKSRLPIDYYLISFTVGNYMDYSFYAKSRDGNDSILVQNYIYNDTAYFELNKTAIDNTADLILLFTDLFGKYPFRSEKYGHCLAPAGGGMENQTMTTLTDFYFFLVAHELAHSWFGDYVTCGTWQDIWINEGFATYAEYVSFQYLESQDRADSWILDAHNSIKLVPNGSVYVPEEFTNNEDRIFDSRLSYKKGAAIIHMIRQEVGNDSLFFKVLSGFVVKYKNGNATGIDFKNYLEEITGKNFGQFFDQWYFGQGYPIHDISWSHSQDTLYINSLQTVSAVTPFFNVLLEFKISVNNKDTLIALRQTSNFNKWQIYIPGTISSVEVDPHYWLLFKLDRLYNINTDFQETKFKVIPNPTREKVNIHFNSPMKNYLLYLSDSSGRVLHSEESTAQNTTIDIYNYPKGIYFITIKDGDAIYHEKFLID
jgi:aminopeptidase N